MVEQSLVLVVAFFLLFVRMLVESSTKTADVSDSRTQPPPDEGLPGTECRRFLTGWPSPSERDRAAR